MRLSLFLGLLISLSIGAEPVKINPALVEWPGSHEAATLSVQLPNGEVRTMTFASGENPSLRVRDLGEDGQYGWELRSGALVQSGTFSVSNGTFLVPGTPEALYRKRIAPDQTFSGDVYVDGNFCAGADCTGNESLDFRTILLRANNTSIHFEDTSTTLGFPTTDWRLQANETTVGGANKFTIGDATAGTTPLMIEGAAPDNAFVIDSTGRIGLGTTTPASNLHVTAPNTPAIRLEQASGVFANYAWELGGNEYNFFIGDKVVGRYPFKIRPGAPTSSVDIQSNGNVGVNCNLAASDFVIASGSGCSNPSSSLNAGDAQFTVASSRTFKENLTLMAVPDLLDKVEKIRVYHYDFIGGPKDRVGLIAEDFHAIFERGSEKYIDGNEVQMALWLAVRQLVADKRALEERVEMLEAKEQTQIK